MPDPLTLEREIASRGEWFHNIDLGGVWTAPRHFLGDYPNVKWKRVRRSVPDDLAGASVLDLGCNAGFYSIEMKRRNAGRVIAVDVDDRYLEQGRFAAATLSLDIEFRKMSVYETDQIPGQFDLVLFLGVFYHLRYPLLALDRAVKKVAPGGRLIFQTMLRGAEDEFVPAADYDFWDQDVFRRPDFPAAYFIEKSYSNDYTNWYIPNRSGAEGMLRSAGLEILDRPEAETWVCTPRGAERGGEYIVDLELSGRL